MSMTVQNTYGNLFLDNYNSFVRLPNSMQRKFFQLESVKENVTNNLGEEALKEIQSIASKIFSTPSQPLTSDERIMLGMGVRASITSDLH